MSNKSTTMASPTGGNEISAAKRNDEGRSLISPAAREARFGQRPVTVLLSGAESREVARELESLLFSKRYTCVLQETVEGETHSSTPSRNEFGSLAEVAKLINDAGQICIMALERPETHTIARFQDVIGKDRVFHVKLSTPEKAESQEGVDLFVSPDQKTASELCREIIVSLEVGGFLERGRMIRTALGWESSLAYQSL